jgi:hypothetical protein
MEKNRSARRRFIKLSAIAATGLAVAPFAGKGEALQQKKLKIVCLGALGDT